MLMDKNTLKSGNIKDLTQDGKCSKCGNCCGLFIPFTHGELDKIKQYVKQHNIKQVDRIDKISGAFKAQCCFRDDKTQKCLIYEVRPYVCRNFMCNNKDWKARRDEYEKYGDYNSTYKGNILASFDDLIYQDYEPILKYLISIVNIMTVGNVDTKDIVKTFKYFNRVDLLDFITGYDENNNKISGKEMLEKCQ